LGKEERVLALQGHTAGVCSLAYSPQECALASGGADKAVRLWDLGTRQPVAAWKGHRTYAHAVAFTADGRLLASAGGDLFLRDPVSGVAAVARPEAGKPTAGLALAPDGRLLITVGRRLGGANTAIAGDVKFWDAAGAALALGNDPPRRKGAVVILPANSERGEAALAGLMDSERLGAWSIALDPAGALLAVGTDGGGVLLWDVPGVRRLGMLKTTAAVRALAFSGDGRLLAAAEASRVQVWDVQSGLSLAVLKGHEKQVWSVAFLPGAKGEQATLVSGSQDGTVRLWTVNPARPGNVFRWPLGAVRAVAVAPNGMTAAAGGENGSVVVWDLDG
jgi:WD40 repeat protein